MRTKDLFRKVAVIILSAVLLAACSKTGPAGPQGLAGPKGDKGDNGAKGVAGAKGTTGTANVIYSDWISFTPSLYSGAHIFYAMIKTPKITRTYLDKAEISVYMEDATDRVIHLDYTFGNPTDGGEYDWLTHDLDVEVINVWGNDFLKNMKGLRYIIIPGAVHLRVSAPLPDLDDYHAVCRYYGIPE